MMQVEPPLLSHLLPVAAPAGLLERVLETIQLFRFRQVRRRLTLSVFGFLLSVSYAFVYRSILWEEIRTSSFVEFMKLSFSDPDVVFVHAKDFLSGLLETLPLGVLLLTFLGIFFLVGGVVLLEALHELRHEPLTHSSVLSS